MRGVAKATTLREVKKLDEDRLGWAIRLVKERKGGELKVQCGASTPGLLLAGYLPPEDLVEELWRWR